MRITINPSGGLANRMRSLASGLALAHDLDAEFDVIWGVNEELFAPYDAIFSVSETLKSKVKNVDGLVYLMKYDFPRKRNLFISWLYMTKYDICLCDSNGMTLKLSDDSEGMRKMIQGRERVYIQSGIEYYPLNIEQYRRLYMPSARIRELTEKLIDGFTPKTVGIHIRCTDNNLSILHSPNSIFVEEMQNIIERDPDTNFFLATDSESVKRLLRRHFGKKVMMNDIPACRNTHEGMLHAGAEMYALSKTREIIGSFWSSFSEAAGMLGNIPIRQLNIREAKNT